MYSVTFQNKHFVWQNESDDVLTQRSVSDPVGLHHSLCGSRLQTSGWKKYQINFLKQQLAVVFITQRGGETGARVGQMNPHLVAGRCAWLVHVFLIIQTRRSHKHEGSVIHKEKKTYLKTLSGCKQLIRRDASLLKPKLSHYLHAF